VTIGRYRNKVQDHSFTDEYLPGRARPGDYAAFHAEPSEGLDEEKERQKVDTAEDTQVEQVTSADLPQARPHKVLREEAGRGEEYQRLPEAVKQDRKPKDRDMVPYGAVWEVRGVKEEMCRKGERIVIQEGQHKKDGVFQEGDTYMLANPGLVEAPNIDHSTTVPCTGNQHKDEGSGHIDKTRLDKNATPAGDIYQTGTTRSTRCTTGKGQGKGCYGQGTKQGTKPPQPQHLNDRSHATAKGGNRIKEGDDRNKADGSVTV
jgi:hypothetical protein